MLTATSHSFGPDPEPLWESLHRSLAEEARDGAQIVFQGAGHGLHTERAHEVAEGILGLIPAPRS